MTEQQQIEYLKNKLKAYDEAAQAALKAMTWTGDHIMKGYYPVDYEEAMNKLQNCIRESLMS